MKLIVHFSKLREKRKEKREKRKEKREKRKELRGVELDNLKFRITKKIKYRI
ncbi:MAG: hypothetical protein RR620_09380 [Clostridium sp.]